MGIQLNDHELSMIKEICNFRRDNVGVTPFLFGYLRSRVDAFVTDRITREQLADDASFVELLTVLDARCSTEELRQIACGEREIPGEDVQSGQ